MLHKLKQEKGITLATVIASIFILVIISSMLAIRSSESIAVDRLNRMYNDIKTLQDRILVYYGQTGLLPYGNEVNESTIASLPEFELQKNVNDTGKYYEINLSKLDNLTMKNGNKSKGDAKDVYFFNESTLTVYYLKGVQVKGKIYYTKPLEEQEVNLSSIIDKKNANTLEKMQGIANMPYLGSGMEPIKYLGDKEESVANVNNDYWYDYGDAQMYAQMKLSDGSQYVWIPRFAYNSSGNIKFINTENKWYNGREYVDLEGGYAVAPDFNIENNSLTGIWLAKYEASNNNEQIQIKAGQTVWNLIDEEEKRMKCLNIALVDSNGLDKTKVKTILRNQYLKENTINYFILSYGENYTTKPYSICIETTNNALTTVNSLGFRPVIVAIPSNYEIGDGNISYNTLDGVPVPKGFYYVRGTVNTGTVITDDYKAREGYGNEFVWVPVDNPQQMYGILSDGTKAGKLYTSWESTQLSPLNWTQINGVMNITDNTSFREPDIVSTYDGNATYLQIITEVLKDEVDKYANKEAFKQTMQEDFNKMVESVVLYGGFYVGRYETSLDNVTKRAQSKTGVLPATAEVNSANTWYGLYAIQKAYSTNSVQGSMIWGCQYDAMLSWMLKGKDRTKVISTGYAPHGLTSQYNTGSQPDDRINNIYDLEGNGFEWTLEAYASHARNYRGGLYITAHSPSFRDVNNSIYTGEFRSSRLSLYIK